MITELINDNATIQNWTRNPRVLLVEDDPRLIASLQRNFHAYRIDLEIAFHGYHGVSSALAYSPDVIITDLNMPLANGEEMLQCLSHMPRTRNVPIVVVTGRPGASLSKRLRDLGVYSVLNKPTAFPDLLAELHKQIPIERVA